MVWGVLLILPSELSSELLEALWCRIVLLFSMDSFRWWWRWWWSLSWWSSRQKRPSSRKANSSPGTSCFSQATQVKHSKWKILFLALITKSFFPKERKHLSHLVPNNLKRRALLTVKWSPSKAQKTYYTPDIVFLAVGFAVSNKAGTIFVQEHLTFAAFQAGCMPF